MKHEIIGEDGGPQDDVMRINEVDESEFEDRTMTRGKSKESGLVVKPSESVN